MEPRFCGEVFVMEQEEMEAAPKCAATLVIHISDTKPLASGVLPSLHSHLMHYCSPFVSAHESVSNRGRVEEGLDHLIMCREHPEKLKQCQKINFQSEIGEGFICFLLLSV